MAQDTNNVLLEPRVCVESVRDNVAVTTWTTVTTGWDKHADKMSMRKTCAADRTSNPFAHISIAPNGCISSSSLVSTFTGWPFCSVASISMTSCFCFLLLQALWARLTSYCLFSPSSSSSFSFLSA